MEEIRIDTDYIKLDQFLKLVNLVDSGGQAKFIIKNGEVQVNKEIVYERGRKIKKGDSVTVGGDNIYIVI